MFDIGSESSSIAQKTYELTREAYYKIRTKDEEEVKVTAEHPLFAKQFEPKPLTFWEYMKTESLTKKLLDSVFK